MPEIEITYPEKFLKRLGRTVSALIYLEQSKYPMGKKAGHWENEIFRKIFLVLAFAFGGTLIFLDSICNKIFKIKH